MSILRSLANERLLLGLALILLVPALLLNLGLLPPFVHTDESRRAVVALEMLLSGDYLTPTLNGELYFNKPPLYNWVIALYFWVSGSFSAFVLRLPSITGLLVYSWLIYHFAHRFTGKRTLAIYSALALITCGRVFFYDSWLGLIDLSFGALIFLNLMVIYRYSSNAQWLRMYVWSYTIMSLTFLMKGFPAIVFQGISLVVAVYLSGKPRKLFSWQHVIGFLSASVILGIYYYFYLSANKLEPEQILQVLWRESANRTPIKKATSEVIVQLFTFPLKFIYDFLPWTLFGVYFLRREARAVIGANPFLKYCLWIFGANIIVYWVSPGTMPRYLFPLIGVLFIPLIASALQVNEGPISRTLRWIFIVTMGALALALIAMTIIPQTCHVPFALPVAMLLASGLLLVMVLHAKFPALRFATLVLALIITRIGFNWYILPSRLDKHIASENSALEVVRLTSGKPLFLYKDIIPREPNEILHNAFTYVIEQRRKEILRLAKEISDPDVFYLVGEDELVGREYVEHLCFMSEDNPIYLVQFKDQGIKGSRDQK